MPIKVGTFQKSVGAAPVSQTISGVGFMPKALILWSSARTSLDAWEANGAFVIGLSDASMSRCSAIAGENNDMYPLTHRWYSSKAITFIDVNGNKIAEATVTFNGDGFELNWTTNDANAYYIHYCALYGVALNAKLVEWTATADVNPVSVNTVGFRPDVVLHVSSTMTSVDAVGDAAFLSISAMDRTGVKSGVGIAMGANNTNANFEWSAVHIINQCSNGSMSLEYWVLDYSSMDADGFTVTKHNTPEYNWLVASLCLAGGDYYSGMVHEKVSVGTQSITDPNFEPDGVLFFSGNAPGTDAVASDSQIMFGAMDGASQAVASFFAKKVSFENNTLKSISANDKCICAGSGDASTTDAAHLESLDAVGFTIDWTVQTNDLNDYSYILFGNLGTLENPTSLTAVSTCFHRIDVTWDEVAGADGYSLERSPNGSTGWAEIVDTSGLSYADDDRECSTTYYYRIRSYIGGSYSSYSDVVNATTPSGKLTLSALAGDTHSINLSWGAITCATDYSIEMSLDGIGGWVEIADTNLLVATHDGLDPTTTYCYRGRAYYDMYMIYAEYSDVVCVATESFTPIPLPTVPPYPGLTIWTSWSTLTTLQSKKVPWAHRSNRLLMPGWMGKDTRIKSTDPALGKLVAKFKREGHRVLGDFTFASRSVQSPGVSSWSVEAKESVYEELYRWTGDVDLDIRFQTCGYVDDPINWQMIKRMCKAVPTDMGTAGETIIDADDDKETMISMTMSSNRHQIMVYRVAAKNLMFYNEEEFINYEYPEIAVGDGLECGYYVPAIDGVYSQYKLVYWDNDNVGMMGSALLPHEPVSISSDDNTIVTVVLSDGSVYWSNDCGRTFYASTGVANGLVVDVYSHNNVLVGCTSGVYRSTDGGRSFSDADPYHAAVTDVVAICHHDDKIAYALCDNSAVVMSEDGGETFMKLSTSPVPYPKDMAVLDGMVIVSGYDGTGAPVIYGTDDGNYWKELLRLDGSIFYGSFTHTPKVKLAASGCGVITASVIRNDNKYGLQHSELYRNVNWGMSGCWEPIWEDYRPLWDVNGLWFVTDIACSDVNDIMAVGRILGADPLYFGLRFISGEVWRVKTQ